MNRSAPLRRAPMKPRSSFITRTPFTAQDSPGTTRRAARDTGPDAATRKLVLERDGYCCVCCGKSIEGQRYSLQHRDSRGMGGSRDPEKNAPQNLITMLGSGDTLCHGRVESRSDPEDLAKGYRLLAGDNPLLVPVEYHTADGGFLRWLTRDGGLSEFPPLEAA